MPRTSKFYIITECPYSGILTAIINHGEIISNLGFIITFIVPKTPRPRYGEAQDENIEYLKKIGEVVRLPLRRKYIHILKDYQTLKKFFSQQEGNKVVISYAGYAGKLCRLLYRHGCIKLLYHAPQSIDIIRKPLHVQWLEYLFERWLATYASYYLACGPEEANMLTNHFQVPTSKLVLIANYIKTGNTAITQTWEVNAPFDYLILGRLSKDKRVEMILGAITTCGLIHRTLIIGDGPESGALRKNFPQATFLGRVSRENLHHHLRGIKWILSASIMEGLPFSVLEMMSNGIVPILSDVRGHRDIIIDGYNGFLFKSKNDLVNYISKLSVLPIEAFTRLSLNAKTYIKDHSATNIKNFSNHLCQYE